MGLKKVGQQMWDSSFFTQLPLAEIWWWCFMYCSWLSMTNTYHQHSQPWSQARPSAATDAPINKAVPGQNPSNFLLPQVPAQVCSSRQAFITTCCRGNLSKHTNAINFLHSMQYYHYIKIGYFSHKSFKTTTPLLMVWWASGYAGAGSWWCPPAGLPGLWPS